jgi:hypothetical protein
LTRDAVAIDSPGSDTEIRIRDRGTVAARRDSRDHHRVHRDTTADPGFEPRAVRRAVNRRAGLSGAVLFAT